MPFPYEEFDLSGVRTYPLQSRASKTRIGDFARPVERGGTFRNWFESLPAILGGDDLRKLVRAIVAARRRDAGIVWGLGLFGGFPTMFGLFFTGMALKEGRRGRPAPVREPTPTQKKWRTRGTVLANVVFLAGFALVFLYPDDSAMKQFGAGFLTIGAGALLHFVVQSFPPAMDFEARAIFAIVGLGFIAFGYGAWMMG